MKLAIFLLSLTGLAMASLNEVLVRHPGGIGGIFKGPNLETIVKGPDGSVITSQQEGAEVRTNLEAEAGGAVIPGTTGGAIVPVVPAPAKVGRPEGPGLIAGVVGGTTAPASISSVGPIGEATLSPVINLDVAAVPGVPSIQESVRGTAGPLPTNVGLISGVSPVAPSVSQTVAVSTGGRGQLPSSTLPPIPPSTRNLPTGAVRQSSPAISSLELGSSSARGGLELSNPSVGLNVGNVALSGPDVLSTRLPTSTYSPIELDLSSTRGNLGVPTQAPAALSTGNVQLQSNFVLSTRLPTSTYSPTELDPSSTKGSLGLFNITPIGLISGNVPSFKPDVISYSPSLSPVRGNLVVANETPVAVTRGNVPLYGPDVYHQANGLSSGNNAVVKVPSSTFSPVDFSLQVRDRNLPLPPATPSSTHSPPPINLQQPIVSPVTSGRLLLPYNEIQTVPPFPRARGQQSIPSLGGVSKGTIAFPINNGEISSTQVPSTNLQVASFPDQLLLDPSAIPTRNVIPPEIGVGRGKVPEQIKGKLYHSNSQQSGGSPGLLRDTNPVGRSDTSAGAYDRYEDPSEVLANRYGKRRT